MSQTAGVNDLWCHECEAWVPVEEAHLVTDPDNPDAPDEQAYNCKQCDQAILCDYCGQSYTAEHEATHDQTSEEGS